MPVKTVTLPAASPLALTLDEALRKRRTSRNFAETELIGADLAALLFACAGITSQEGKRTTPSTRGLKCITPYVLRSDGVWRYEANGNKLIEVCPNDVRAASTEAQEELVRRAACTIVFVLDKVAAQSCRSSGPFADAGCMAQSASLAAASLGLAGVVRASFDHEKLRQAMQLSEVFEPILLYSVGPAAEV